MKNIDDKGSNMAKGVNIETESNELKGSLFNKKRIRHKMKKIQSKKHKIGIYKIKKKNHYCVLMTKDLFYMMEFIHLLILLKS